MPIGECPDEAVSSNQRLKRIGWGCAAASASVAIRLIAKSVGLRKMQILDSKRLKNRKSRSKLGFTTTGGSTWDVWDRFISLGDEQLFHIGNVCDTCEFFFRRTTDRIIPSLEIERIRAQLESGLDRISDTALAFTDIIPNGNYIVALFRAQPRKAGTDQMPDYFTHEQRFAWREYDEEDLTAATSYYRGESRAIQDQQMLFEFFIPLYNTIQHNSTMIALHITSI